MNLKKTLINIIETEQLTAFFQPVFCTNSNEIEGYEALSEAHQIALYITLKRYLIWP